MTKNQWFTICFNKQDILREFIVTWHPVLNDKKKSKPYLPITAGMAEKACEIFREEIKDENHGEPILLAFNRALDNRDIEPIMNILNECWFGVPESSSCWNIPGFSAAVRLLEDPPEEE